MRLAFILAMTLLANGVVAQEQVADLEFDTRVANPQLTRAKPRLLFDEAHFNVHRSTTTYRAFADLVRNDGAQIIANTAPFSSNSLSSYRILVIAGPLGGPLDDESKAGNPAFTPDEIAAVKLWVRRGGGLLLLTDHEPVAGASAELAEAFGVKPGRQVVSDPKHRFGGLYPTNVLASHRNGLLRTHAVTCGVDQVLVFGGQSLSLPEKAVVIGIDPAAHVDASDITPTGNAQLGAFQYGRGRVVITGDMGMLSAQRMVERGRSSAWGMNLPGIDNRALVLNLVRWLARQPTRCST